MQHVQSQELSNGQVAILILEHARDAACVARNFSCLIFLKPIYIAAKFTDEQCTTINQSTAVDWLIVVYCSSVNFATISTQLWAYTVSIYIAKGWPGSNVKLSVHGAHSISGIAAHTWYCNYISHIAMSSLNKFQEYTLLCRHLVECFHTPAFTVWCEVHLLLTARWIDCKRLYIYIAPDSLQSYIYTLNYTAICCQCVICFSSTVFTTAITPHICSYT